MTKTEELQERVNYWMKTVVELSEAINANEQIKERTEELDDRLRLMKRGVQEYKGRIYATRTINDLLKLDLNTDWI